ncbi:MAG: TlpA family protein disulfide reductase [Actinobacteria bacterium]|nr:TlpA family protein disulfide reductase [Actinomycetota bacterium]
MALTARRATQALTLVAVAALLGLLVWKITQRDATPLAGLAPSRPLELLNTPDKGSDLSITDLRGKAIVVNFWASWCIPCKDETPFLQRVYERHKDDGLVILGIDNEDLREDAIRFLDRYGVTYPAVYSKGTSSAREWRLTGYPETFFVDRSGRLVGERIQGAVDIERNREAFDEGVRLVLESDAPSS